MVKGLVTDLYILGGASRESPKRRTRTRAPSFCLFFYVCCARRVPRKRARKKKLRRRGAPNGNCGNTSHPSISTHLHPSTHTMASSQSPAPAPTPKPTLAVPEELGEKDWVYMPGFWFIEGEACNRRKDESDKAYLARVRKNKANRDRRLARERACWDAEDAARAAEPAPAPAAENDAAWIAEAAQRPARPEDADQWKQIALYWQNRCQMMEARFMTVIAAVGHLHRTTAVEVEQAIREQPE